MVKPKEADSPPRLAELHKTCIANRFELYDSVGPYVFGVPSRMDGIREYFCPWRVPHWPTRAGVLAHATRAIVDHSPKACLACKLADS